MRFPLLLAVVLFGAACGENSPADPGSVADATSSDAASEASGEPLLDEARAKAFAHGHAEAFCAAFATCCPAPTLAFDLPACVRKYADSAMLGLRKAMATGTRLDPAVERACLEAARAYGGTCNTLPDFAAYDRVWRLCFGSFDGLLPDGAPCESHAQCARPPGGYALCNGICNAMTIARLDEPCGTKATCEDGLRCAAGRCRPLATEGQVCISGDCAAGLYCASVCRKLKADGLSCSESSHCASALCSRGLCQKRAGVGEACGLGSGDCGFSTACLAESAVCAATRFFPDLVRCQDPPAP